MDDLHTQHLFNFSSNYYNLDLLHRSCYNQLLYMLVMILFLQLMHPKTPLIMH